MVFRLNETEDYKDKTAKLPIAVAKFRVFSVENKDDFIYVDKKTDTQSIGTRTTIKVIKVDQPCINRPLTLFFNVEHPNEYVSDMARADLQEFLECFARNKREVVSLNNNLEALKDKIFEAEVYYRLNSEFPSLRNYQPCSHPNQQKQAPMDFLASQENNQPVYQQINQPVTQSTEQKAPQSNNSPNQPVYQESIPPQPDKDGIPF